MDHIHAAGHGTDRLAFRVNGPALCLHMRLVVWRRADSPAVARTSGKSRKVKNFNEKVMKGYEKNEKR